MFTEPIEELAHALAQARNTLVVTGSGISASAGLPTYRGTGAPEAALLPAMSARTYHEHLPLLWSTVLPMVAAAREHGPTAAHRAIEVLRRRALADGRGFTVATQNIDGLHGLAGTPALELHGTVLSARETGSGEHSPTIPVEDTEVPVDPHGRIMRPHAVFFGEQIHHQEELEDAVGEADLLVMVGTSGNVWPVAGFVNRVRSRGAITALVNLEPWTYSGSFSIIVLGEADEVLCRIAEEEG